MTISLGASARFQETRDRHIRYFLALLKQLPGAYASLDTSRMTVAYFCISGLDILGALDMVDSSPIIDWVYAQQLRGNGEEPFAGGFRGGGFLGSPFSPSGSPATSAYDAAHIAMTYTALSILTILGDDLSRVDRDATLRHVRALQESDGSFCTCAGGESDMRFVYCAAAICTFLRDGVNGTWEGLDVAAARAYVLSAQAYDGALGMGPGMEAHGGST
jgi:geranylgeranyl transferase type-1 subunit beta